MGATTPRYWANLDVRRPSKDTGFVLDVGRRVRPFITPDDPDAFAAVLQAQLPDVSITMSSQPRYGV